MPAILNGACEERVFQIIFLTSVYTPALLQCPEHILRPVFQGAYLPLLNVGYYSIYLPEL